MNVEYIVNELKANGAVAVAKKIDMNDKKLRKILKAAGYEYSRKSGMGWYFAGTGEPPLKADIREFITGTDDAQVENADNSPTKKVVSEPREMQGKEKSSSQKNTNPIHPLQERIREDGLKERVSRTVYIDKETCTELGIFEDVLRINRDDIIEIALREFFKKYKM
ncbi:CopG family transcriptional regulator [Bacillus wiedmannii]|uniref:CopG family transcriptional regulator n=1 Tax=Bacillus wiedmannii TaxID=1890302 RepID=UPI000B44C3C2|nr:CopG family transcriptional regulator [Bacillus thuringiensis serovar argentinensis]